MECTRECWDSVSVQQRKSWEHHLYSMRHITNILDSQQSLYIPQFDHTDTPKCGAFCAPAKCTHNITPRWIVSRYLNPSNAFHFVRSFFLLLFSLSVGAKFISKFLGMNDSILRFSPSTRVSFGSKLLHWESYDLNRSLWLNFKLQFALQCEGKCSSEVI